MITVNGVSFDISIIINEYTEKSVEKELLNTMSASTEKYQYDNLNQLKFELNLRKEIVNSAINLNDSGFAFSNFKNSKCNPTYWVRTDDGGFLLNKDSKPNEAINDIFTNGSKYATECATAIIIIYYKALLNIYGVELFNKVFINIFLMGWNITEPLLGNVITVNIKTDVLPGDRGYFINPDFNPANPEWQGENVIILPDSLYYGHGIGITSANTIIQDLNSRRLENASQSAYLLSSTGRLDFKKLFIMKESISSSSAPLVWKPFPKPIHKSFL